MNPNFHCAHRRSGTPRGFFDREPEQFCQVQGFHLSGRELIQCLTYFEGQARIALCASVQHFIRPYLQCNLPAIATKMLDAHFPHDGKKPRFKRSRWIVGVSGSVHGNKHFLANILKLSAIGQMPTQKACYQRADFVKQDTKSLAIPASSALHELRPAHALLGHRRHYTVNCRKFEQKLRILLVQVYALPRSKVRSETR
jgi:hypothetical protein